MNKLPNTSESILKFLRDENSGWVFVNSTTFYDIYIFNILLKNENEFHGVKIIHDKNESMFVFYENKQSKYSEDFPNLVYRYDNQFELTATDFMEEVNKKCLEIFNKS